MGCTSCGGGGQGNADAFRAVLSETRSGPMTGVHVEAGPVSLVGQRSRNVSRAGSPGEQSPDAVVNVTGPGD